MKYETVESDITVIGGGLAGVCAAVSAARLGKTVSLIQNRPVLGGNSSSEVRVWVSGANAVGTQRYARETGIMGEMLVENQYRNPEGNPYYWDLIVYETVYNEPNITLHLNTDVHEVEATGENDNRVIQSVTGWMMGSERKITYKSEVFLDCTGDGLVGFLAGAEFKLGREARHEYDEEWAPDEADNITLGSTILFYTKDIGTPVKYVAPAFARDITQTLIPEKRIIRTGDSGCYYWWIEWGGEMDTVHQNEAIRDELWAAIYGIWDYIKNSGKFDADNLVLEWVGSVPGKREYRRFVGDYMLNQNDIISQRPFDDRIAFGGWSIDLHPPKGMYTGENASKHLFPDGLYHIPFRSLYSRNVSNMFMAGRNISATHVAFGTTRVMATCAVMGEAAGVGAALCVEKQLTPRELYENHFKSVQQTLLKQDASIIGARNEDVRDQAKLAKISASSTYQKIAINTPAELYSLKNDVGILFPVDQKLTSIELLVDATIETEAIIEVWDTGRGENYIPRTLQNERKVIIPKGEKQWITVNIPWTPNGEQNVFIVIKENEQLALWKSKQPLSGVLTFEKGDIPIVDPNLSQQPEQLVVQWSMKNLTRQPFCLRVNDPIGTYLPDKVINGYHRPFGSPHMWMSEPNGQEEWIELTWDKPIQMDEIHLTFNDDVNEYLINLHFLKTEFDIMPELVANYRIEMNLDGQWQTLDSIKSNRKRKRVHHFETFTTDKIRVVIEETNGSKHAELIEVRVY
ncbi:FAD-dependent oxidoreductase [Guptibacillus hwajinpoensis]|uniref:FAD-dependent oxidoreductase n=1 Tax=Guptibacillus hwajinpoensis TaxID=208199 RepID=UPI0024B38B75|nr:FAD-dependent oxidoreductase [Pseudalkalibacillus hwajinpoensis]